MTASVGIKAAGVLGAYRTAIADNDRAICDVGNPEARLAVPVDGNRDTLRWVMPHMTSENGPPRQATLTSCENSSTARQGADRTQWSKRRLAVSLASRPKCQVWIASLRLPAAGAALGTGLWLTRQVIFLHCCSPAGSPSSCNAWPPQAALNP